MEIERGALLRGDSLSVLADAGAAGTALTSKGSVLTIWKISGDITSVSLYSNCSGTYRLAQSDVSGTQTDMTYTFTGNQPIRIASIGYNDIKLVGNAAGVVGFEFTG
jgi:hypothetical protein